MRAIALRSRFVGLLAVVCFLSSLIGCHNADRNHLSCPTLPTYRVVDSPPGSPAPIRFRFPPPIEGYSGEVPRVTGWISLGKHGELAKARGRFEVDVTDVTLGEADLDMNVRNNAEMLHSELFPVSRFEIDRIESDEVRYTGQYPVDVVLHGTFSLKGVSVPLSAKGRLLPRPDVKDPFSFQLEASFELTDLRETFNIAGPGGENEPAGNRMLFEVSVPMSGV